MAKLLGTGPLTLTLMHGNYCSFDGHIALHYKPNLVLQFFPYSSVLWNAMKSNTEQMGAGIQGNDFAEVNSRFCTSCFFLSATRTSLGLPACKPSDRPVADISSPECAGEPSAVAFDVTGHGSLHGVPVIVAVAVIAPQGDVYLSHVIALVSDILSGKIH